MLFYITVSSL